MNISRIPNYSDHSFDGMLHWFATMSVRDLLFHPDDPAETIQVIATGEPTFSPEEASEANAIMKSMFSEFGDKVYDAAYPIFMKCMGQRLDA